MFLSFGEFSCHVFFPIGYGLSVVFRMILFSKHTLPQNNSPLNNTFLTSLVLLSMGILEIILLKNQKSPKSLILSSSPTPLVQESDSSQRDSFSPINTQTQIEFISDSSNSFFSKSNLYNYTIIFIVSLTNFFSNFIIFNIPSGVTPEFKNIDAEIKFVGIIYVCYLCKKVLKDEFRKHHIFSLCLIIISDMILCIFNIVVLVVDDNKKFDPKTMISALGGTLIGDIYFSSKHVTEKYLMDKRYLSPYRLLFIEGVFSFIINAIVMICFGFVDCPKGWEYCKGGKMFSMKSFLNMFKESYVFVGGFFVMTFMVELCMTSTSKYYTPALRPIFDIMLTVVQLTYMYNSQKGDNVINTWVFCVKIVLYVFVLIGCFIFNEVIMIGLCGLNKDLKDAIAERGKEEYVNNIQKINQYIDEDNISNITDGSSSSLVG